MKKLIYILLAISLLHQFTYTQWVQQNSSTSSSIQDIQFINLNTGWACAVGGIIIKTTNSGVNWFNQSSGVTKSLNDIFPVDSEVVYCVGQFETILKSTNGGNNWNIIRDGPFSMGKTYHGVHFINRNTGWLCGVGQWVLKTTDGGVTFDSNTVSTQFTWDIYFKDNMNGLIAGQVGTMFKTTNGGNNWNLINMLGEAAEFYELSFIGDYGWTIGLQTRQVYKTTNFGASWDSSGSVTGTTSWFFSIFFSSLNTGWVCGDLGSLYRTSNGGSNWYQQVVPMFGYGTLSFYNDSIGWAAGSVGTVIHTTSSGQIVGVNTAATENTESYLLLQNYPNPFNPKTRIKFDLPLNTNVSIKIYDILGNEISELINNKLAEGEHEIEWDASSYSSGIYYYSIITPEYTETKKMILIK